MARLTSLKPRIGSLAPRLGHAVGDERARDRERSNNQPWRAWYKTARWGKLRLAVFLRDHFTCRMCMKIDGATSRLVCDHVRSHKGDEQLFWDEGNLQTLCKPCHDGLKQRLDKQSHR